MADPLEHEYGNTAIQVRVFCGAQGIVMIFSVVFVILSRQITWLILAGGAESYYMIMFSNPEL
jgi:hypothetical protein